MVRIMFFGMSDRTGERSSADAAEDQQPLGATVRELLESECEAHCLFPPPLATSGR